MLSLTFLKYFFAISSLDLTTDRSPEEKQCVLQLWLVILRVYSHWMRQFLCAPTMMTHHVWMTVTTMLMSNFKNVLEIVILSSLLLFVLARQPSRNVFVWLSQRSVGWFITSISELTSVDQWNLKGS